MNKTIKVEAIYDKAETPVCAIGQYKKEYLTIKQADPSYSWCNSDKDKFNH